MTEVTPEFFVATGEAQAPGRPPVRVVGGIPGERADVEVIHRGGNYVHARWRGSPEPSSDRVPVRCAHITTCGGCPWLHVAPGRAHQERAARVGRILGMAGVLTPVEAREAPPGAGRQLVKLVAADLPGGGVRFGAYRPRSHDVGDISGCIALPEKLRGLTHLVLRLPPGVVRFLIARQSTVDSQVLATLVVREDHPELHGLEAALRRAGIDGLALHQNRREGDALLDPLGPTTLLWGIAAIRESVGSGVDLTVGPTDFFQTNPVVGRQIWAELPDPGARLIDLYAGVGAIPFAMWARDAGLACFGVEENAGAAARAGETARRLGADVRIVGGAAGSVAIPASFADATVMLNPPRKGTSAAAFEQVMELDPSQVVYISCHPEPLARDLALWQERGFRAVSVRVYDMFPGTPHVETVVVLRRP
ncbi:MAG: class I SAM-dependent RNA methyltransferase [Myxococcales bacterium]|nr:class I SAM-dependent RNA methyltransferase [Myxococcales bacterium]